MARPTSSPAARGPVPAGTGPRPQYGSDLAVALLRASGIRYLALNPGASLRGLHDSAVNFGGIEAPELLLCCHEEIAVNLAHGYAKAAGTPMAAGVHDLVGLQHATMGIYSAWLDQEPVLVLGGTGPMDRAAQRPWIDPIHTAFAQGQLVRDYVKWDDQPGSVAAFVDSWVAGYRAAVQPPAGPVYLCYDAALQEAPVPDGVAVPEPARLAALCRPDPPPGAPAEAVDELAAMLLEAEAPVLVADLVGTEAGVAALADLATTAGAAVIDLGSRLAFPSTHPLDLTDDGALLGTSDVILAFGARDVALAVGEAHATGRGAQILASPHARVAHVGWTEARMRGWSSPLPPFHAMVRSVVADPSTVAAQLAERCRQRRTAGQREAVARRAEALGARHEAWRARWRERAQQRRTLSPVALEHLAVELGAVLEEAGPWTIVSGALRGWPRRLWALTSPQQFLGTTGRGSVGFGLGIGLGAALALRERDRLCVALQPDGDLLYTPSALWTAARHRIPLLIVMMNNRSYYNDEEHQANVARQRGRPVERKTVAIRLEDPAVDFARLAEAFGVRGFGPVDDPARVGGTLREAARYVRRERLPVLVDVVTQMR